MLALFLDHYGVRSVVFNSEPEVRRHPKGSTHNSRTMEHHRRLGIAPRIRDLCLPIDRPTDVSYYTSLTGWELGRMPHAVGGRQAARGRSVGRHRPDRPSRCCAPTRCMSRRSCSSMRARRPNITVRFGWT